MEKITKKTKLYGKTVWITGGKRIGQTIALNLAEQDMNIIVSYNSSKNEADEVLEKIKKFKVKTMSVQCNVSDRESVSLALKEITKKFKNIDALVLLASIFKPVKLEDIRDKDFDQNMAVHIKGTFWPIQLSLPFMKPGSHIVTISDRTYLGRPYAGYLPYIVSKGAISTMTKTLALELGPRGIFINSIAPGPILKPGDISEKEWQKIRSSSKVKYPITDEEAVQEFLDTVVRLLSIRSTGHTYPLDLGHI